MWILGKLISELCNLSMTLVSFPDACKIAKVKPLSKVAHMVNLKLAFMDWFFYNLIILIKLCQIWYLNLDEALLFLRNQVICLKN